MESGETLRAGQASALPTRPVRVDYMPDPWPGERVRIGLIALGVDHAVEAELWRMLPRGRAELYVSRVTVANPCTVANLRAILPDLTRATSLILPGTPLGVIAFACTSGTVVMGVAEVADCIRAARPGIAVTTPITAAMAAFERLGVSSVAMLTPYIDEVNQPIRRFLEGRGMAVVALDSFNLVDDIAMSAVPPAAIHAAALDVDSERAEAVFISCTGLRATGIVADLEARLGKPVVTSNQAMLWHALRLGGYGEAVPGFGRLLELAL
ncbi:MAG: hypothetical protein GWN84_06970 [Gammaproteobacteria bacterium]|nr:hypothetical protein [Gammaproteobacteria bacterium]NIR82968.1 hypothetical protein [Gammaproteobacteria bacterium]NIR90333.1 hypothetical protein [Gammaproteobacteria bacterium]NIU04114.1 hypothetical protein [Gammaproteobacteria bacterium]NIV51410.1 hypothetical protein [Gammaproteobacteria bacterium]